jgi:hypothetical protein
MIRKRFQILIIFLTLLLTPLCLAENVSSNFKIFQKNGPNRLEQLNFVINQGDQKITTLTIQNNSTNQESISLKFYAVDGIKTNNGSIGFKLQSDQQLFVGKWIKFDQSEITLKPQESVDLALQVKPDRFGGPGEYAGAVITEIIPAEKNHGTINFTSRVATPVFIKIPGQEIVKYNLDNFTFSQLRDQPVFDLKFTNSSNIILETNPQIAVRGVLGEMDFDLKNQLLLPGNQYQKNFLWPNPPLMGTFKAELSIDIFRNDISSGQKIKIDTVKKTIEFMIIPLTGDIIFLTVLLIILIGKLYFIRNKQLVIEKAIVHTVKKDDDIKLLAQKYNTTWKKIVNLNKLKKPYTIKPGQKLQIPKK